ncbi:hypothetical protein HDU98_000387, partial [Podochytrium sp. JEL0797]
MNPLLSLSTARDAFLLAPFPPDEDLMWSQTDTTMYEALSQSEELAGSDALPVPGETLFRLDAPPREPLHVDSFLLPRTSSKWPQMRMLAERLSPLKHDCSGLKGIPARSDAELISAKPEIERHVLEKGFAVLQLQNPDYVLDKLAREWIYTETNKAIYLEEQLFPLINVPEETNITSIFAPLVMQSFLDAQGAQRIEIHEPHQSSCLEFLVAAEDDLMQKYGLVVAESSVESVDGVVAVINEPHLTLERV